MQKQKLIIVFTVLVDVIGFGIVVPILPFYVTSFGASPIVVTLMFSAFSLCAFLSSPFLGALSDRIGRRPVLILSITSTAIGWFVFSSAHSILFLFLGRIIDGCAAGNFTTAQSYLVDISRDEKERTSNLGLVGAAFGIGFMIGPMMGGLLGKVSPAFPFFIAGVLATVNTISAMLFLPETHHHRENAKALSFNPLLPLTRAAGDRKLRPFYVSWMLFALAFVSSQAVFALFAGQVLGFDAFQTAMVFTGMGIMTAINQGLLLKRFWLKKFAESSIEVGAIAACFLGMVLIALKSVTLFWIALLFLGFSQSLLRVVITSQVAGRADPNMKGETIGILGAIMAACMVVGPIIAGAAFEVNPAFPYFIGAGYMALSLWFAYPVWTKGGRMGKEAEEAINDAESMKMYVD